MANYELTQDTAEVTVNNNNCSEVYYNGTKVWPLHLKSLTVRIEGSPVVPITVYNNDQKVYFEATDEFGVNKGWVKWSTNRKTLTGCFTETSFHPTAPYPYARFIVWKEDKIESEFEINEEGTFTVPANTDTVKFEVLYRRQAPYYRIYINLSSTSAYNYYNLRVGETYELRVQKDSLTTAAYDIEPGTLFAYDTYNCTVTNSDTTPGFGYLTIRTAGTYYIGANVPYVENGENKTKLIGIRVAAINP